jgi:hypothetical protein
MFLKLNSISSNFRPNKAPIIGQWYGPYLGEEGLTKLKTAKSDIKFGLVEVMFDQKKYPCEALEAEYKSYLVEAEKADEVTEAAEEEVETVEEPAVEETEEVDEAPVESDPVEETPEADDAGTPEPAEDPEPVEEEPEPAEEEPEEALSEKTVEALKQLVLSGDASPEEVRAAEKAGKKRKSLLSWLDQLS